MTSFENDSGETVVIAEMDKWRLVHSIAKYARISGINRELERHYAPIVGALKAEAVRRMEEKPSVAS